MSTCLRTAAHVEARARAAKTIATRKQFQDAAQFYRKLATLMPGLPQDYVHPTPPPHGERDASNGAHGAAGASNGAAGASPQATRWLARAEECRALSEHTRDTECRAKLVRLADGYESMAMTWVDRFSA